MNNNTIECEAKSLLFDISTRQNAKIILKSFKSIKNNICDLVMQIEEDPRPNSASIINIYNKTLKNKNLLLEFACLKEKNIKKFISYVTKLDRINEALIKVREQNILLYEVLIYLYVEGKTSKPPYAISTIYNNSTKALKAFLVYYAEPIID